MQSDEPAVRYFALIKDGGSAEEATGLVRRVPTMLGGRYTRFGDGT